MSQTIATGSLFGAEPQVEDGPVAQQPESDQTERMPRLDTAPELLAKLRPYCRLAPGEIWQDPVNGHRIGCLDATDAEAVERLAQDAQPNLAVNDPPYNLAVGTGPSESLSARSLEEYVAFSRAWTKNTVRALDKDASFYLWLGADVRNGFQPLPDVMVLFREFPELAPRNFITMRNQRGYGTQANWMWVRQELLYYVKGSPLFNVEAEYTDIPKILRGYYKEVNGKLTENGERSKSEFIRAGNVWVDIQQVFYRLEENVPGCYAQKPLKAIERIVAASSATGDAVLDLFAHSGTTLVAGERLGRRILTCDIEPVFAELAIRRLERLRKTGKTGWQWQNPFPELESEA